MKFGTESQGLARSVFIAFMVAILPGEISVDVFLGPQWLQDIRQRGETEARGPWVWGTRTRLDDDIRLQGLAFEFCKMWSLPDPRAQVLVVLC
jgi:hypothetical protein